MRLVLALLILIFASTHSFAESASVYFRNQNLSQIAELKKVLPQVKSIEILVAGGKTDSVTSRFGHSSIRFVTENPETDFVIHYVADIEGLTNYWKGVSGGYPVTVQVESFMKTLRSYVLREKRSLKSIRLPSRPENRAKLVALAESVLQQPGSAGNYYFLGKNCTGVLFRNLYAAGLTTWPSETNFPMLVSAALLQELVTPEPALTLIDPTAIHNSLATREVPEDLPQRSVAEIARWYFFTDEGPKKIAGRRAFNRLSQEQKDRSILTLLASPPSYQLEDLLALPADGASQLIRRDFSDSSVSRLCGSFVKLFLTSQGRFGLHGRESAEVLDQKKRNFEIVRSLCIAPS